MSGRIRTVKPELLEDALTAGLSDMAFRIFVSSILLADDYGNLRLEPAWLRGQIYWAHQVSPDDFAAALGDVTKYLVIPYTVKGQRYGAIRNWSKHQRVQKPGKPRVPGPPETLPPSSGDPPESLSTDLRSPITDHRPPTGEGTATDPSPAQSVRSEPEPDRPSGAMPTGRPEWFDAAVETVQQETGETLRPPECWLRYAGHRANKGITRTQQDAVYWLTTVMVPEARKERRAESDRRERERTRAGPGTLTEPRVETAEEQRANADALAKRIADRKARQRGAA